MITFLSPRGLDPPDRDLQFDYEVWGSAEHEQLHLKREHAADIIRGCMWDLHCQLCQRAAGQWAEVFFAHGVRVLGLASPGTGFCFHCRHGAKHVGRLCTFGSPPVPAATSQKQPLCLSKQTCHPMATLAGEAGRNRACG